MTNDELENELQGRSDQLARLGQEADRQLDDVHRRRDNASTRAGLIIGAAAIASGVQLSTHRDVWMIAAVAAALVAAGLSVPLLSFATRRDVNPSNLLDQIGTWSPRRLELEILNVKLLVVDQQERQLVWRTRLLLWSLISLALAIAFTLLEIFF